MYTSSAKDHLSLNKVTGLTHDDNEVWCNSDCQESVELNAMDNNQKYYDDVVHNEEPNDYEDNEEYDDEKHSVK